MTFFKAITALTSIAACVSSLPVAEPDVAKRQDLSLPWLNTAAVLEGKLWFGSEIDTTSGETSDAKYMKLWNDTLIWGQTTPGNTMKWLFTEPEQNTFTLTQGFETVALARDTLKRLRCHNLVWYTELPYWVTNPTVPWTNATLLAAMENHITNVVKGFGNNCYSWDVVNEALNGDGTLQNNTFLEYIGPAYVPLAFRYAEAAVKSFGGNVKLFYNDYNLEYPSAKLTGAVDLVETIKAYGAQIDGVGFESHFIVGETPSATTQAAAMASLTALGMDIHQTEIDVRFLSLPPTPSGLAQQASDYYNTVQACMTTPKCRGMTVWDFDDAYSWIPSTFPGQGDADLYWANLTRKPAYDAVYQAIVGETCTVC